MYGGRFSDRHAGSGIPMLFIKTEVHRTFGRAGDHFKIISERCAVVGGNRHFRDDDIDAIDAGKLLRTICWQCQLRCTTGGKSQEFAVRKLTAVFFSHCLYDKAGLHFRGGTLRLELDHDIGRIYCYGNLQWRRIVAALFIYLDCDGDLGRILIQVFLEGVKNTLVLDDFFMPRQEGSQVECLVQIGAHSQGGIALLLVNKIASCGNGDVPHGIVVQGGRLLPAGRPDLPSRIAWTERRVVNNVIEFVRRLLKWRAGHEFILRAWTKAIDCTGEADEGAGDIVSIFLPVPCVIGLQTSQIAVHHAAAKRMRDEIQFSDAQIIFYLVNEDT